MSGPGQQQVNPGSEQLDPGLEAEFEELLERTVDPGVKKVLERNKAKLLSNGITSDQAVRALSREDIIVCGLNLGDAAILKLAFPSPATAGGGGGVATHASGSPHGSVTVHYITPDTRNPREWEIATKALDEQGRLDVRALEERLAVKVLGAYVTPDVVESLEGLKGKEVKMDQRRAVFGIHAQPGDHVWLKFQRQGAPAGQAATQKAVRLGVLAALSIPYHSLLHWIPPAWNALNYVGSAVLAKFAHEQVQKVQEQVLSRGGSGSSGPRAVSVQDACKHLRGVVLCGALVCFLVVPELCQRLL